MFTHLPHTLLVTSLAFAATALPVQSTELLVLTPDNFEDTTAHGLWFVEHFSPYCGHCRRFAPTWERLVESYESQPDPGVQLAQVNCAVHGDLCREHNVDGYPQMNLYRDGQFVETFKKPREFELLTEFLADHIQPTPPPPPEPTPTPPPVQTAPDNKELLAATFELLEEKLYNPSGNVVVLKEQTFTNAISDGHVFVKFYAPWCGHCKKLAPIWTELAHNMRGKLKIAEVNCEEQGALCRSQGVTGYPMLYYYPSGKDTKMEYTGGRKLEQLVAFAEKLSGPPALILNEGELPSVVAEHPVVYLLLRSQSETESVQHVIDGSHVLFGTPPIYISSSEALFKQFNADPSVSVLLALKDHEQDYAAAHYKFTNRFHKKDFETWLVRNKLPTTLELYTDSFQEVMNAPHRPLVVLVAAPKSEFHDVVPKLEAIATQWKRRHSGENVVFTYMDVDKWASWLKNMYGVKQTSPPSVVIASHSKLVYYDTDPQGQRISFTAQSILSAVTAASHGTIAFKHSENIVERMARYLNDKMVGVEKFVSNRPWTVVAFIVIFFAVLFIVLRRLFSDDIPDDGPQYRRLDGKNKASRLD